MRENSSKIVTILLDLVMPKVNGIEVLKIIRREKIVEDVPIFIITADKSEETMYEAYELGVKDVLEKPFVPYFLKKRIESVIELYKVKEAQKKLLKDLNQKFSNILKLAEENKEIESSIKNILKEFNKFEIIQEE